MMSTTSKLLEDALALPEAERAELTAMLLGSLDEPFDADAAEAWVREIERRVAELDTGNATLVPWSEVHSSLRERAGGLAND